MNDRKRLEQARKLTKQFLHDKAFILFHDDPVLQVANYTQFIQEPMYFGKILEKLDNNSYKSFERWKEDVDKIFANSRKYNSEDDLILLLTSECQKIYRKELKKIDPANPNDEIRALLNKFSKLVSNAPKRIAELIPKDDKYTQDQLLPFKEDDNAKLVEKINNLTNEDEIVKVTQIMDYFNIPKAESKNGEVCYKSDQLTEDAKRYLRATLGK